MAYLERGQFTICQKTFKLGSVYNMVTHVSKWQRMYWPDNGGNGFLCLEIENSRCQYQKLPIGCSLYMYSIHGSWIISWNLKESRVKSQESSSFLRLPETSSYQTTLLGFFFLYKWLWDPKQMLKTHVESQGKQTDDSFHRQWSRKSWF